MPVTVKQMLDIYRDRLDAAAKGITHPHPHVVIESENLVEALEKCDSTSVVQLDHEQSDCRVAFTVNGIVIATFTAIPDN